MKNTIHQEGAKQMKKLFMVIKIVLVVCILTVIILFINKDDTKTQEANIIAEEVKTQETTVQKSQDVKEEVLLPETVTEELKVEIETEVVTVPEIYDEADFTETVNNILVQKEWNQEEYEDILNSAISHCLYAIHVLDDEEVAKRLENNLKDIIVEEDGWGMYEFDTMTIKIDDEFLRSQDLSHEMTHALSFFRDDSMTKAGFYIYENGQNSGYLINEAFTDFLVKKSYQVKEEVTFSNSYKDISYNTYFTTDAACYPLEMGLYISLFYAIGDRTMEEMYFGDLSTYKDLETQINTAYGEGILTTLENQIDAIIGGIYEVDKKSEDEKQELYDQAVDTYGQVLDLVEMRFEQCKDDEMLLVEFMEDFNLFKSFFPVLKNRELDDKLNALDTKITR